MYVQVAIGYLTKTERLATSAIQPRCSHIKHLFIHPLSSLYAIVLIVVSTPRTTLKRYLLSFRVVWTAWAGNGSGRIRPYPKSKTHTHTGGTRGFATQPMRSGKKGRKSGAKFETKTSVFDASACGCDTFCFRNKLTLTVCVCVGDLWPCWMLVNLIRRPA